MRAQHREATTVSEATTCALCIARFSEEGAGLLPETDAEISRQHRAECPDCRLFTEQLDLTRDVLAAAAVAGIGGSDPRPRTLGSDWSVEDLRGIATALGIEDAEDVVQEVLVEAIADGRSLHADELVERLAQVPTDGRRAGPSSLSAADRDTGDVDPDSDTAELFYPAFYGSGPDEGRFLDSPNDWGHVARLAPEDEVATIELYGITDAALDDLSATGRRLLTLVDVEGVPVSEAAAGLDLDPRQAAQALNRARIHVRGAIDQYLGAEATRAASAVGR
jgi:DNA-directed RNA polymerase specialized sigma24 family protein